MNYIGIDPGLDGAIALIPEGAPPSFWDTPTLQGATTPGKKTARRIYDEAEMARLLRVALHCSGGVLATIEQVHSMPKQGVASSFTFGMGYGIWLGLLAALQIPYRRVTPQRWQRDILADGPKTDQAAVAFAGRLYPAAAGHLRTPRGKLLMGRADALLIAHHGSLWGAPKEKSLQPE